MTQEAPVPSLSTNCCTGSDPDTNTIGLAILLNMTTVIVAYLILIQLYLKPSSQGNEHKAKGWWYGLGVGAFTTALIGITATRSIYQASYQRNTEFNVGPRTSTYMATSVVAITLASIGLITIYAGTSVGTAIGEKRDQLLRQRNDEERQPLATAPGITSTYNSYPPLNVGTPQPLERDTSYPG